MSDESLFTENTKGRPLRQDEQSVLAALLSGRSIGKSLTNFFDEARVENMRDGGMGSVRFLPLGSRQFGKTLAEAIYKDADGVIVSITLNVDKDGNILEMDFWKTDFSPLKVYPRPADLSIKQLS